MPESPEEQSSDVETVDLPYDPEADDFWFFVIEAKVKGCAAEFYLNGFPLTVCSEDKGLERHSNTLQEQGSCITE